MSNNDEKGRWAGLLFGPVLAVMAVTALWKNETRFDYHLAASKTAEIADADQAQPEQLFSLSGEMDTDLTYPGKYVESFTGYLKVWRSAEIYAWDKERRDNRDHWDLEWMSSVESNSRNRGVDQVLKSGELGPPEYYVGALTVDPQRIELVDASQNVPNKQLELTLTGKVRKLQRKGDYFYISKNQPDNLGDERVSYSGVPVPSQATYFGKWDGDRAVADTSNIRTGFVNTIIQDTGILHHIVAGDRTVALATMKSHIQRLKWIIRGIGTAGLVLGFYILFATIVGFLFHIPILGRVAEASAFLVALLIGLPIAIITIVSSYLFAHPILLAFLAGGVVAIIYFIRRRGSASQQVLRGQLANQYGHELSSFEIKEREFIELAQLAISDSHLDPDEEKFLLQWSKKHGWDEEKYADMLAKAISAKESNEISTDEHLCNLVKLAMADGNLSQYEIRSIRAAGRRMGIDEDTIRGLIAKVREGLSNPSGVSRPTGVSHSMETA